MSKTEALNRKIVTLSMLIEAKDAFVKESHQELKRLIADPTESLQEDLNQILEKLNRCLELNFEFDLIKVHFEEVHPNFFAELQKHSSSITNKDLRLASFLKMNLSNKEIAFLTNVSHAGTKKAIQRLRKKLDLDPTKSLRAFIRSIGN